MSGKDLPLPAATFAEALLVRAPTVGGGSGADRADRAEHRTGSCPIRAGSRRRP